MRVTEFGQSQVATKQFRVGLLHLATTLGLGNITRTDQENVLRRAVARALAGDAAQPMASDTENSDAFIAENQSLIEPVVQEAIEGAMAARQSMGLA